MSFETQLMGPGQFTIDLTDDTPDDIAALTSSFFAAVLVMPGPIANPNKVPVSRLYTDAAFVGIHTGSQDRLRFAGYGPAFLLRLAKAPTDVKVPKRPLYNGGSDSWLRNWVLRTDQGETQGLQVGSLTSSSSTPKKAGVVRAGQEPLEILTERARLFSKEWDIRDGNKVHVAARSDLFVTTPTCTAVAGAQGSDLNLEGLEDPRFTNRTDVDDYATTVAVGFDPPDWDFNVDYEVDDTIVATSGIYYECKVAHQSTGSNLPGGEGSWGTYWRVVDPYGEATASAAYGNPFDGADVVARRVEQARNATTYDDATDIATARLGRWGAVAQDLTLDTDTFNITGKIRAGDNLWAFSRQHGLYDNANQVMWEGRPLPAVKLRCRWLRTNVDASMSVLVVVEGGAAVDVSPWVRFESSGQVVGLGEPRRRKRLAALRASGVSPVVVP